MDDEVTQFLKDNPDVHQKIIDNAMQNGDIFQQQAQNPEVQKNYQDASFNVSPIGKAYGQWNANIQDGNIPVGFGGVAEEASLIGKPLTGLAKRGLGEGLQFAKEQAGNFGQVIQKLPGENMAQAYGRVKGLIGK